MHMSFRFLLLAIVDFSLAIRRTVPKDVDLCPGYKATNVITTANGLSADLELAGKACNFYGVDLESLRLEVDYDTKTRLHVKISDSEGKRYQVPKDILSAPNDKPQSRANDSDIVFEYNTLPFSFQITRRSTKEVLFDTTGTKLVFESQYLRLKTSLPTNANIYGLGEHSDPFRLSTKNTTRTLWSRDSYGVPQGSNLYGNHPVYFEHRITGTHGVLLLNSNGMDVKLATNNQGKTSLEYNVIGGIIDLYFFSGPTPTDVAKQYAGLVGFPAMMPYWGFGFHQCRYGYRDWIDVAEVIANHSAAGIPLETMWTDIDYMFDRRIFTLDPERFPLEKMRGIVEGLHSRDQHYILMVDPAVAYQDYPSFNRGVEDGVFLKKRNDSIFKGVVWPGVAAFPDWFHPKTEDYWTNEFDLFFNAEKGVDIDGVWIDMNEPANFCSYPCLDPEGAAREQNLPPKRLPPRLDPPRQIPGFSENRTLQSLKRDVFVFDMVDPPYAIANDANGLSDRTVDIDIIHYGGLSEYDTHNLYGTMMSSITREAMLARRPELRPFIITRSTFAGAGSKVGKWLGDNLSTWDHYRWQIAGMLGFASIYQIPMVGSDVCGFGADTTENLCARWATLGAFNPFFRNHNGDTSLSQEFYRWPIVTAAAKNAIDMRYRLLDYIYTALYKSHTDGTPLLNPLFFIYPKDKTTFGLDQQFFYGEHILVSPVTKENATSVEIYLPNDTFYDFKTGSMIHGTGNLVILNNIGFTDIPVYIRGGVILPLRVGSAYTTTELRKKGFNIVIAPGLDGTASGLLYLDDGESISQKAVTLVEFSYSKGVLHGTVTYTFDAGVCIETITLLGVEDVKRGHDCGDNGCKFDPKNKVLTKEVHIELTKDFMIKI